MIRALIFDFDGLMVDTEAPAFQSWQEIYQAHGCELSLEDWAVCLGTSSDAFDPFTDLASKLSRPVNREELQALRLSRKGVLAAEQAALPGVADYLADAKALGLKIGLASSSPHQWVEDHLQRLGLYAYFDALRCAEDVERVKPDPALYHAVLAALQVLPAEAIVLEDSPNGVRAANRAGIFCVVVPNAISSRLGLDHADLRLASLADVPLAELIKRVEGRQPAMPVGNNGAAS
jgi:HAD superfamily hydrolase (TIGR01509 family)